MPRLTSLSLFLLLLFIACSKASLDEEVQPENSATTDANLVVSIANEQLTTTRLNFAVYDQTDKRVKQVNQTKAATEFGKASFQLEPATYRLVVLAHSSDGNPTMTDPAKIQFKNNQGFTDTFLYDTTMTLGEETRTLNVSLDRVTALCRFVINDTIPEEVTQIQFYYTGGSGAFNATTRLGCVNSKQQMTFAVKAGQTHTVYDLYTFLHQQEGTIKLTATAFDAAGNEYCAWDFLIPMKKNQITWATGYFFADQTSSDAWAIIPTTPIDYSWSGNFYYPLETF